MSLLIWMPPDLQPKDERQTQLLATLKSEAPKIKGAELLQTELEKFKTTIQEKGRENLWKFYDHTQNVKRYRKFIRKYLMRTYGLFWLYCAHTPELRRFILEGYLESPGPVAGLIDRQLGLMPFAEQWRFVRRMNARNAASKSSS